MEDGAQGEAVGMPRNASGHNIQQRGGGSRAAPMVTVLQAQPQPPAEAFDVYKDDSPREAPGGAGGQQGGPTPGGAGKCRIS